MRIVITGSSGGIGAALALRLLSRGHEVSGWARSPQASLSASHSGFRAESCDVSDWASVEAAASRVASYWPSVDALVCCAGTQGAIGPALAADPREWSACVRTNLDGTFFAIRALHGLLAKAPRRAKVVCFSGGGASQGRPFFSAYGCAKTAVVRLVETLAAETPDATLDINALAPGAIFTGMTREVLEAGPERCGVREHEAALKLSAAGQAPLEKALDCVEWLLSEKSDGLRGRLISAPWDPWQDMSGRREEIAASELYQLRRLT